MKKLLPIILLLICGTFVFGQTKPLDEKALKAKTKNFKQKKYYLVGYDKFEDKTLVMFGGLLSGVSSYMWSGTMIGLSTSFSFPGKTLDKSIEDFYLVFSASGKDFKFQKNQRLYVIADDERFDFGEGELEGGVSRKLFGGYQTNETLIYKISRKDLEKFAKAKTIEVKVSNRAFKLDDKLLDGFKNILDLSTVK